LVAGVGTETTSAVHTPGRAQGSAHGVISVHDLFLQFLPAGGLLRFKAKITQPLQDVIPQALPEFEGIRETVAVTHQGRDQPSTVPEHGAGGCSSSSSNRDHGPLPVSYTHLTLPTNREV